MSSQECLQKVWLDIQNRLSSFMMCQLDVIGANQYLGYFAAKLARDHDNRVMESIPKSWLAEGRNEWGCKLAWVGNQRNPYSRLSYHTQCYLCVSLNQFINYQQRWNAFNLKISLCWWSKYERVWSVCFWKFRELVA